MVCTSARHIPSCALLLRHISRASSGDKTEPELTPIQASSEHKTIGIRMRTMRTAVAKRCGKARAAAASGRTAHKEMRTVLDGGVQVFQHTFETLWPRAMACPAGVLWKFLFRRCLCVGAQLECRIKSNTTTTKGRFACVNSGRT